MNMPGSGDLNEARQQKYYVEARSAEELEQILLDGGSICDGFGFEQMCQPWEDEGALSTLVGEMIAFRDDTLETEWEARAKSLVKRYLDGFRNAA